MNYGTMTFIAVMVMLWGLFPPNPPGGGTAVVTDTIKT